MQLQLELTVFDCAHGYGTSPASQYRWYQVGTIVFASISCMSEEMSLLRPSWVACMVDRSTAVIGDVPGRCVCVAVVAQDRPVQHDLLRPDATAAGECTRMQLPTSSSFHSTLQYTVTRKMPSSSMRLAWQNSKSLRLHAQVCSGNYPPLKSADDADDLILHSIIGAEGDIRLLLALWLFQRKQVQIASQQHTSDPIAQYIHGQ